MKTIVTRLTILFAAGSLALGLVAVVFGALATSRIANAQASASVFTVTTTDDAGPGSLREALHAANAAPGADTISFDLDACAPATPCVISLLSALPSITDSVTLSGPGRDNLVVDGNGAFRVFNVGNVTATLSDMTIYNGFAAGNGGGIRNEGNLTLQRVRLANNRAGSYGGGLYASEIVTALASLIENNSSNDGGGGIYADFGALISATTFISNATNGNGGGLSTYVAYIVDSRFQDNSAMEFGGGALVDNTLVVRTHFYANRARHEGGGFAGLGEQRFEDVIFENNRALLGHGGGLSMSPRMTMAPLRAANPAGLGQSLHLTRTQFLNNNAGAAGGGLAMYGTLHVDSSLFIGNSAPSAGGLFSDNGSSLLRNTLFARNLATGLAANNADAIGLAISSGDTVTLTHSTIVGTDGSPNAGVTLVDGALVANNTIVANHTTGIINISGVLNHDYLLFYHNDLNIEGSFTTGGNSFEGDPRFVAPYLDDYHLGPGSAAIDAAAPTDLFQDFEGHTRPLGSGFDIGFDEADLITGLTIGYTPYPTATVNLPVTFTATVATGSNVTYLWQFGDASSPQTGNTVTHIFSAPGVYDVTAAATNSAGTITQSVQVEAVDTGITPPPDQTFLPIFVK